MKDSPWYPGVTYRLGFLAGDGTVATQPITRYSLILRLRDRENVEAWREFVAIYEPVIYRVAQRRGLQHADALEVVQRVLVAVARAVDRFEPDHERARFRTWLHTITQREFYKEVDAACRHRASGDSAVRRQLDEVAIAEDSDDFMLEHRRAVFCWAAARVQVQVKPATWLAFWRTSVDGLTVEAVAAELDLSVGAVYIARSRVMARLQTEVAAYEDSRT